MPATYEPIATATLGSAAATITFSSIPATYTDLRIALVGSLSGGGNYGNLRFNSDSGSNYSVTILRGNGSAASSARQSNATEILYQWTATASSSDLVFHSVDVFSYAGSTFKTALFSLSQDANGSGSVERNVGLWRNSAAITSVNLISSSTWNIGTTATLYGIKNA
jgi:hypothetical protein